jgi:hypothetical protein
MSEKYPTYCCNIYGSAVVDGSTFSCLTKRMTASKIGKAEQHVLPRSGRPVASVGPEILQGADSIVCYYRLITT